jgi:hypothetical protein
MALFHLHLADKYSEASRRPWLPVLPDPPPPDGFGDLRTLAAWELDTGLAATPWIGTIGLMLIWRATGRKAAA